MAKILEFNFLPGDVLLSKYEIIDKLGSGWEGEVYQVREISSGIERAAKLFFPQHNINCRASKFYARKLHKLRQCKILIQYHNEEIVYIDGIPITLLISEFVAGELLSDFVKNFPGQKMRAYMGLQLLYDMAKGIEGIHLLNEYHGDLHSDNIIINRFGLSFDLKLLDMFHWGTCTRVHRDEDLFCLIRIFYDVLGGKKHYNKFPQVAKQVCCGLKRSLIKDKFNTVSQLREYLDKLHIESRNFK